VPRPSPALKTCELLRPLAGNGLLGLAPSEIAKGMGVGAPGVSGNLPKIAAETGLSSVWTAPTVGAWVCPLCALP